MALNKQFDLILQSPTVAVADHVLTLKALGRKVIPLQAGDPDFPTPPAVVEAAISAMKEGLTHYGPSRGYPDLRQAIASKFVRRLNKSTDESAPYDPESEILVTHGGVHAFYLATQSILNPGDEVMIPDPNWATHSNIVKMLRGSVTRVPAHKKNNFIPRIETWKKLVTQRTRAIVINYPANPTGVYPPRPYLQQLLDFASENDLWVISDEVYDNLYYEGTPVSVSEFPDAKVRTIIVNSLSKTYSMTGWRVGYLAAPKVVVENALKAGQNTITCVAPFIQKAAAFTLGDAEIQKAAKEMRDTYAKRRKTVMEVYKEYKESPIGVTPPMGAFYYFLDFRKLELSSSDICNQILEEKGVGLVPGSAFGAQGEGFVRMSIAASDSDVEEGIRAILDWARAASRRM